MGGTFAARSHVAPPALTAVGALRLAGLASTLALSACAAQGPRATPSPPVLSLSEIRQSGVIVQQWDLSCAAAALATLVKYQHGIEVTERAIAESMLGRTDPMRVRIRGGFSLLDLKRYADSRGLKGIGYSNLSTDDLVSLAPTIVPVNFSGFPHFVVFRGLIGGDALLADPAFGNRKVSLEYFEKHWIQEIGFIVAAADGTQAPPRGLAVRVHDVSSVASPAIREVIR